MESSFIEDDLIIPKKGAVSLEINENFGLLKLRFLKTRGFFDSNIEQKLIERKVKI